MPDDGPRDRPGLDVDEAVFDVVERIPPGRVSTYGAIGRLIGIGPRRVARALSSGGGAVPWFRVVRADGSAAEPVRVRAAGAAGRRGRARARTAGSMLAAGGLARLTCCRGVSVRPMRTNSRYRLQFDADACRPLVMNSMACRAVAQAGLCAATASLDDEAADGRCCMVAGWLTTAADLIVEAGLREAALALT